MRGCWEIEGAIVRHIGAHHYEVAWVEDCDDKTFAVFGEVSAGRCADLSIMDRDNGFDAGCDLSGHVLMTMRARAATLAARAEAKRAAA